LRYNNNYKGFNRRRKEQTEKLGNGITVEVRNGDVQKALRLFKKKVQNEGIIQEYKERQFYVKPSEKKRKAKAAGKKRWEKKREKLFNDRGW
tara:strand:- start:1384 stop:1659 length:276 start_codon:yes stop_codon:yes gene_type:complete